MFIIISCHYASLSHDLDIKKYNLTSQESPCKKYESTEAKVKCIILAQRTSPSGLGTAAENTAIRNSMRFLWKSICFIAHISKIYRLNKTAFPLKTMKLPTGHSVDHILNFTGLWNKSKAFWNAWRVWLTSFLHHFCKESHFWLTFFSLNLRIF